MHDRRRVAVLAAGGSIGAYGYTTIGAGCCAVTDGGAESAAGCCTLTDRCGISAAGCRGVTEADTVVADAGIIPLGARDQSGAESSLGFVEEHAGIVVGIACIGQLG